MKTTTNIMYPAFALFVLACSALAPATEAQCPQICDGGLLQNTAVGDSALINNTGVDNTAIGFEALYFNTSGIFNTANGAFALSLNTTASENTATGYFALADNRTGYSNTATGFYALASNGIGFRNTATGDGALSINSTGSYNTANGFYALVQNTTGNNNVAIGNAALEKSTGNRNIALGSGAGQNLTSGDNNIDIGNQGVDAESNTIRIGKSGTQTKTFIAGIFGATVPTGVGVIVDNSGNLGTTTSSARFKEAIKPMNKASEVILALKPVTFRYKHDLDPAGIPQFGLVAEDVEKVNPDLVAHDDQGKPYTVRYEAVNAMLLNEFLKARRQIDAQQKQIEALSAGLEKVSAQLEVNKSAPKTVANN